MSDRIGAELRRIIEYLNRQMTTTEVLAIEVKQYTDAEGTHHTIVPRVIGDTAEARAVKRPSPGGERLDRETLVASIREESALAADAAGALLDWADREPRLDIRYTRTRGFIEMVGRPLLKLFSVRPPKIELQLHTLADHGESWDAERIERLVREFADIGVNLDPDERRWPKAPLEPLANDARRERFLALMERVLDSLPAGR